MKKYSNRNIYFKCRLNGGWNFSAKTKIMSNNE